MNEIDPWRALVEAAFEKPELISSAPTAEAIEGILERLDRGELRVAEKIGGEWTTNAWVKMAILLYFRLKPSVLMGAGPIAYFDKVPLKSNYAENVRRVPGSIVRYSAFVESGAILLPSFVNVGARVGSGTMIDTWATVGSCAQVGRNCHVAGGVGIGGVLEPPSASPVIIEDHCFIGSRCIVVEGAVVEEGSVLGANTVITASTQIIDVTGPSEIVMKGRIPANSVVIPGVRQRSFPSGSFGLPCALIIGKRSASTDRKTSLNSALRDFSVPV